MKESRRVLVSGAFDNIRSPQVRFLQEAARRGDLHLLLWSDSLVSTLIGTAPRFPLAERSYFLQSLRYVTQLSILDTPDFHGFPPESLIEKDDIWALPEGEESHDKAEFYGPRGIDYILLPDSLLAGYPLENNLADQANGEIIGKKRQRVVVTGCFDWFHSGHIRFFEEVSELGDLYVIVGHDANIKLLKGEGHPMFSEQERQYLAGSVRFVTRALISSGHGWMDGEPEIHALKPEMYAVNEDGDKPEKRKFCEDNGIRYIVLKRTPKEGLPARNSTDLRGF